MKETQQIVCQSCGMPMRKAVDFGTNEDDSLNEEYCKFCYQSGEFYDAGITLKGKIDKNIEMAVRMGIPREGAKEMANQILPTLNWWKT